MKKDMAIVQVIAESSRLLRTIITIIAVLVPACIAATLDYAYAGSRDPIKLEATLQPQEDSEPPGKSPHEQPEQRDTLSLENCIDTALKNQPGIIAAASTVKATRSKVSQAQSKYYPQLDFSLGYTKTRVLSATGSTTDQYMSGGSLQQNVYDFGKTSTQVDIQRASLDSSSSDLENTAIQVVFNVKQAYYELLRAKRSRDVNREMVGQYEKHLKQAEGFYKAGVKAKIDVIRAEVDLSNAKLGLIKAENALRLAKVTLNKAMGISRPLSSMADFTVEDNLVFQKYDITLEGALEEAFRARPDLKSTEAKKKAALMTLDLRKKDYYPTVTASAAYNSGGETFTNGQGWNVGIQATISVFNGFLTKYQVEEAKANITVATANEEQVKQNIIAEVEQAYLNLTEAQERIPYTELALKQAKENLDIANGRYATQVGNPIEVTDAEVTYSNAHLAYIQALTDYKISQASMEKAMGRK